MNEELLNHIFPLTESNPNFSPLLNPDLRRVLQHCYVLSLNAVALHFFISGIHCTLNTYHRFSTRICAVFNRSDRSLPTLFSDIKQIIALTLSQNKTMQGHLRARLDCVRDITTVSMNEHEEEMNRAIFNAERLLPRDQEMGVLRNSYQLQQFS
jgi:hypothetical protein